MKNSGVEWIGEIPENWEVRKVKHSFIRKNEKAMQENPTVLSLARSGVKERDISNNEGQLAESYYNYNPVDIDDLLINPMDLYSGANCSISKVKGVISPAYINLRAKKNVSPVFYDYYFKVQYWMMAFFAHGNGVSFENRWTLNNETLQNYPIVAPSFETQQRIASYLDKKCSKIEETIQNQQQVIEKLKAYKQSLITEAVTGKVKIEKGKACGEYESYKDSGVEWIGKIPSGWVCVQIKNIFRFLGGYAFNGEDYVDETEYQILRIGNVKNFKILFDASPVYISKETAFQVENFKLRPGYILFTMTGTRGKKDYFYTHEITKDDCKKKNIYLNQRVGCLIPKTDIDSSYFNYLLKDNLIKDSVFLNETGTANQANIGSEDVMKIKVHCPPKETQKEIASYLDKKCTAIDTAIEQKQKLIEKLTEYKKSLIYECVTGKKEI